ncbi:family 43 glycosylhydrolase [Tessaracoccus antarcticus]|uniref:Glycosyl hydrolase n=1 Tax=Tessaracoccus antarcticus TaxID=2479848 RepID=A0A3M0G9A2_9ACTN|nr:family 43 glycosylhydrolase [Tessaracoccus antarcticus]RMB61534.1 glycosyl hydrolase [Tessaracoccus antarcticus]
MRASPALAVAIALALLLGISPPAAPDAHADATPAPPISPVIKENFPDPDVLQVGGTYHAYATNSDGVNVQHATSKNLRTWTERPDAMPTVGDWVGPCSVAPDGTEDFCVWAPEVTAVEGGYALYYTAHDRASDLQCIGLALAKRPEGPFVPVGEEALVCPTELGGAIDAATYVENGQLYLLWKADGNCCSLPTILFIQPLSNDGATLMGPPVEMIRNDQPWEGSVVEAPTLVRVNGTYHLFYSANDYYGGNYRTGWATSNSLAGPWKKAPAPFLSTDLFRGGVVGPGGQDVVVRRDGSTALVFHGWDPTFTRRAMYVRDLDFIDGVPVVDGASRRYEAEQGRVVNARVVADDTASASAKVGGMDARDSAVTVRIHATRSGSMTLGIRYSNGSRDEAGRRVESTDNLLVNGRRAGSVSFEHTTWGNWQVVEQRVKVKKGWNEITLTRGTWFAELDAVDVYRDLPRRLAAVAPTESDDIADGATRYEAEAGAVTNARIVDDASASGGRKVGGMDFADSSVTLRVWSEKGGRSTLGIRFANGSERGGYPLESSDRVSVNGRRADLVVFPHTRWGNWQRIEHTVQLARGWNTITMTRASFYTEIDAVDVRAGHGRG